MFFPSLIQNVLLANKSESAGVVVKGKRPNVTFYPRRPRIRVAPAGT